MSREIRRRTITGESSGCGSDSVTNLKHTRAPGRAIATIAAMPRGTVGRRLTTLRDWSRAIKRDTIAVYLAVRDPRVPWYAKLVGAAVAAYALSPIDLIPDFIPVLGYLDDAILVPLGLMLARRLIPPDILAEHRAAAALVIDRHVSKTAAAAIVLVWIGVLGLGVVVVWRSLHRLTIDGGRHS